MADEISFASVGVNRTDSMTVIASDFGKRGRPRFFFVIRKFADTNLFPYYNNVNTGSFLATNLPTEKKIAVVSMLAEGASIRKGGSPHFFTPKAQGSVSARFRILAQSLRRATVAPSSEL